MALKSGSGTISPSIEWIWREEVAQVLRHETNNSKEIVLPLVRNYLCKSASALLTQSGQNSPPFDPRLVAPLRNVIEIMMREMDRDAMLVPSKGGFTILLNPSVPKRRARFAIAHEVAHTFLYDISKNPPAKPYNNSYDLWQEETLCNEIAREMLMPEKNFIDYISRYPFISIPALENITARYDVSYEAAAHQIKRASSWNGLLIIFDMRMEGGADELVCSRIFKMGRFSKYSTGLKPGKPLNKQDQLYPILSRMKAGQVNKQSCQLSFGRMKGTFEVESTTLGKSQRRLAMVIRPAVKHLNSFSS